MKNRWALRLAALTLVSCLAMSGVSLAVEPGSASDPLVTLSYLNDVFLGQIMTKVDQKIAARNKRGACGRHGRRGRGRNVRGGIRRGDHFQGTGPHRGHRL